MPACFLADMQVGFHADFLAEWHVGEKTYEVLICFGCKELEVFSADRSQRYDTEREANKPPRP